MTFETSSRRTVAVLALVIATAGCLRLPDLSDDSPGDSLASEEHRERITTYLDALVTGDGAAAVAVACTDAPERFDAEAAEALEARARTRPIESWSFAITSGTSAAGGSGGIGRGGSTGPRVDVVLPDGTEGFASFFGNDGGVCSVAAPEPAVLDAVGVLP